MIRGRFLRGKGVSVSVRECKQLAKKIEGKENMGKET